MGSDDDVAEYQSNCIPQNDMDCFYNKKWKQKNKLYGNRISINNFTIIQDKINNEMIQLIEKAKYNKSNAIENNMAIFRDSYHIRNQNLKIFVQIVALIEKISTINDLSNVITLMNNIGVPTLFSLSVMPHFKNPDVYTLVIGEIPLTLDTAESYTNPESIIINNFTLVLMDIYNYIHHYWNYNLSNMDDFITNIIVFEIIFSKTALSTTEAIDPKITYNSAIYNDFLNKFDANNFWKNICQEFMDNSKYVFYENEKSLIFIKKFIEKLSLNLINLDMTHEFIMLKDYLVYCLVKKYGFYTTVAESFNLLLLQELNPKELFIETFYDTFGYYLQSLYESKYFNPKKNKYVQQMFNNIKEYCIGIFNNTNMFQPSTKLEAIKKLNALDIIIGKQGYDIDLSKLPLLTDKFYENLMIINMFYFRKMIKLIGQPANRHYLSVNNDLFSFIVNAYYDPVTNMMYVPTCMMNDTFLNLYADPIDNYGSMGLIIGHEIIHGFDNFGSLFDNRGHLENWWTDRDHQLYNIELDKIRNHYSTFKVNDIYINPKLSISEDIADIGGLKLSFRTYIKNYVPNINMNNLSLEEKNHLKKFFKKWTESLRTVDTYHSINHSIKVDVHSPNIIRINATFSHLNEYYQIFDVKPYHQNYLEEDLRTKFLD